MNMNKTILDKQVQQYNSISSRHDTAKIITAKKRGVCKYCHERIHRGQDIWWAPVCGSWHIKCLEEDD